MPAHQRPGAPHIERPDEIDAGTGGTCFINHMRVCGPDCVAYNLDEIDEQGSPRQGATQCTLIVLGGQIASGIGALVELGHRRQRAQQTPQAPAPPKVPT